LLHQVGDLFELNVKLRCQKVNQSSLHGGSHYREELLAVANYMVRHITCS